LIVVDTNVIAYLCIGGDQATLAEDVLFKDNEWHAPVLWRSEFRNVMAGFLRRGAFDVESAGRILAAAETLFFDREHLIGFQDVLPLVTASACSAYDCEFVALATRLQVPLVTNDRQVLAAFPETARSLRGFLDGGV
jgi:predicted nucleic acid-binding protein